MPKKAPLFFLRQEMLDVGRNKEGRELGPALLWRENQGSWRRRSVYKRLLEQRIHIVAVRRFARDCALVQVG